MGWIDELTASPCRTAHLAVALFRPPHFTTSFHWTTYFAAAQIDHPAVTLLRATHLSAIRWTIHADTYRAANFTVCWPTNLAAVCRSVIFTVAYGHSIFTTIF